MTLHAVCNAQYSSRQKLTWQCLQAVTCIVAIIAGGRLMLRPIYRRIADMGNPDVFAATTLLVVLGTSVLTQVAGLSLALGAFLVSLPPLPIHILNSMCAHTSMSPLAPLDVGGRHPADGPACLCCSLWPVP